MVEDTAALQAHSVSMRYGDVPALSGVSLTVATGSCVALVGESGSGKTTLLRCFNRMVEPDSGSVLVGGTDVSASDTGELRRSLGYVQQDAGLLPHWSVLRNVAMVPWLRGRTEANAVASRALDMVGLPVEYFGDRWPRELSGGQRQRAAFARALADEPGTLLLDEPFGALDAITRVEVRRTFVRLRDEIRITVLLVTHDLREAFELADEVAVMRAGGIEQVASPADLRGTPATPYVRELLEKAGVA